jgi:hypothetical protein
MLLNISIRELKLIRQAVDELVRESIWDEVEEYAPLIEKLDKELEYYEFAGTDEDSN